MNMKRKTGLSVGALMATSLVCAAPKVEERPNILWLTFEDTSWYEFGCYGNRQVHTPVIDNLAAHGLQYMNAWSVAPQSSPARSSLITGCYATTYGMDVHPVSCPTPENLYFPQLLRNAGYYCTNNSKTHYNSTVDNKSCWDECSRNASYHSDKRVNGQPFFAVYNTVTSHMGRVRTFHTDGRRDYTAEGIRPALLSLPPHVPDLPEMRSDYAGHLEAAQDVDTWVGYFLDDLKARGLDENTIVFVFSDHGGCLPRGKGYLYETGLRVPMVVYFPPKWRHLIGNREGVKDSSLISFIDLGPTVLSLAGVKPPKYMQGKALLGKYASEEETKMQFAFGTNQLHHYMPVRAAMDKRYKYIRSYIPYRQFALRNYYQWGMPSNKAWDRLVLGGHNTNPAWHQPFAHHAVEMLFDLETDTFELNNLAGKAEYADVLQRFRTAMGEHLRSTVDLGFFLPSTRHEDILYNKVRQEKYPLEEFYTLVEKAGMAQETDFRMFCSYLSSESADMRYWAVVGIAQLAVAGKLTSCPDALLPLMQDDNPYVAAEAAYACAYLGHSAEAVRLLATAGGNEWRKVYFSALECLSLDKEKHRMIATCLPELQEAADRLPHKKNEDAGLMAKGILVNLGVLDIELLHGPEAYEAGLKLNYGRRARVPLP